MSARMKVKLPESARERKRSFGGTSVSTLLHAALIGGTVVATGKTVETMYEPVAPVDLVYVVPRQQPPAPEPPPEAPRPPEIPTDVPPVPNMVVKPVNLAVIPEGLPPVDTRIGTTLIDSFKVATRDSTPAGVGTGVVGNEPLTEAMVEKAVQARAGNPTPKYPSFLASAGVEGAVYAQFVVDTTGRVEPESIRFTKSDHALFEREVRQVLLKSRFVPAEFGRHRVRQRVEQAFAFALKR
ncbi:MAG: TonB family protein [Gemmatimonadetes bacterium]|nr:TonB family protein [Gemmatimonadota bacterium]